MYRPFFILLISSSCCAYAQEISSDSTKTTALNEVVVESKNAWLNAGGGSFIPSAREKNLSSDAYSLLLHMSIPQLNVSPASNAVTTSTGRNVAIFIDYVKASSADLEGMLTTDVKRVEYLVLPRDPRFHGEEYVVNFIMQKYEWGGYTKLTANGCLFETEIGGSLYSKMNYKKMTFDLAVSDRYSSNSHNGTDLSETISLYDSSISGFRDISRKMNTISSTRRTNRGSISFQALYSSEKINLANNISYIGGYVPRNNSHSIISYIDNILADTETKVNSSEKSNGLQYNLQLDAMMSEKAAMSVSGAYSFTHNRSNLMRRSDELDITNDALERAHHAYLTDYFLWSPDQHNSLSPFIHGEARSIGIDYIGNSSSEQKYTVQAFGGGLRYMHVRDNWHIGAMGNWVYGRTDMSGIKSIESYPQGNIFGSFSPTDHHRLEASWGIGKEIPETYQKSPVMLRQDEFIWYAGNPDLKSYLRQHLNLSYAWIPNNKWQVSVSGSYYHAKDPIATLYIPDMQNGYLIREYENNGSFRKGTAAGSVSVKLLNGSLAASLSPEFDYYRSKGEYNRSLANASGTMQLTWYFSNFYLMGWVSTPYKSLEEGSGACVKYPTQYQLQLGWGRRGWRARIVLCNFLNSDWKTGHTSLSSTYYNQNTQSFGYGYHRSIDLQLSYTFGYGKKITREETISDIEPGESAILR